MGTTEAAKRYAKTIQRQASAPAYIGKQMPKATIATMRITPTMNC